MFVDNMTVVADADVVAAYQVLLLLLLLRQKRCVLSQSE